MLRKAVKPIYHFVHDTLFDTIDYNPFFKKKHQGQKIRKGHISAEHLQDKSLDDQLCEDLVKSGIPVHDYSINVQAYKDYLKEVNYPISYYGGGKDPKQNFTEKTLEHFVSTDFINFNPETVFVDIAACTSPFYQIVRKLYGATKTYQQDLVYPKGFNGDKIGGFGHELPFEPNTVDGATLHCSLEHFEGRSDIDFFKTMGRVLKPGGKVVVLPFYIAGKYTIHVDPVFNFIKRHKPQTDPKAELRYCSWYQFFSRHYDVPALHQRILDEVPELKLEVFRVQNFKSVDPKTYLRFIGVFTKQ